VGGGGSHRTEAGGNGNPTESCGLGRGGEDPEGGWRGAGRDPEGHGERSGAQGERNSRAVCGGEATLTDGEGLDTMMVALGASGFLSKEGT